jgi:pyridoxal phosphate enzyme (YggS family)
MTESGLAERLLEIDVLIGKAAARGGRRREDVLLVAVSKKQSIESIAAYVKEARVLRIPVVIGESYVQEFKSKCALLPEAIEPHLIGPLQSNKIRDAVGLFEVIESVHSEKVLLGIAKDATRIQKQQRILLQVNISKDPQKSGFLPDQVEEVIRRHCTLSGVIIEGLMAITALYDNKEDVREDFRAMQQLLVALAPLRTEQAPLQHLSMGMSDDFEIAVEEGATMVRVGSRLFGSN